MLRWQPDARLRDLTAARTVSIVRVWDGSPRHEYVFANELVECMQVGSRSTRARAAAAGASAAATSQHARGAARTCVCLFVILPRGTQMDLSQDRSVTRAFKREGGWDYVFCLAAEVTYGKSDDVYAQRVSVPRLVWPRSRSREV